MSKGIISLFTTSIIFGVFGILALELRTLNIFEVSCIVNIIQAFCFGLYLRYSHEKVRIERQFLQSLFILLSVNTLPLLLFNAAIRVTSIGGVLIIQNIATIVFSYVYDYFIMKTAIDMKQILLIFIAIAGIASLYLPFNTVSMFGIFAAAGVGFSNGMANVYRGKLSLSYSIPVLSFLTTLASSLVWFVCFWFTKSSFSIHSIENEKTIVLFILYAGLSMITTVLLFVGFRSVKATLGNLILMLEIIFGILTGTLFTHEYIPVKDMFTIVIIITSIFIIRIIDIETEQKLQRHC